MKELEREFQKWILDVAARYGWRVWHMPTPMRPIGGNKFVPDPRGRGFPDLVMMHERDGRLIFAEVKDESGVLSEAQEEFLRIARGIAEAIKRGIDFHNPYGPEDGPAPVGVYVWRPANRDLIEATLRGSA